MFYNSSSKANREVTRPRNTTTIDIHVLKLSFGKIHRIYDYRHSYNTLERFSTDLS